MATVSDECESNMSSNIYETKPNPDGFRWIVLLIVCICVFSFIWCYDNPFALQSKLQDEYNLNAVEYNLLYSVYGYVNAILPLFSGLLIDCIGLNSSSLLFYILIVIGQTVWLFGCWVSSYPLMLLGRSIFGGGAQPFHTSRKYYYYEYFLGKEYSFAAGVTLFASRIASATQSYVTTFIFDAVYHKTANNKTGIVAALSVGWALVMLSLMLFIMFLVYRKYKYSNNSMTTMSIPHIIKQMSRFNLKNKHKSENEHKPLIKGDEPNRSKFNLPGLWRGAFDRRFWILALALICFYASYLSFTNIGSSFLQQRYNMSYSEGNEVLPIPLFIAAFSIPLFGFITDKYGKRCQLLTLSACLLVVSHLILGFAPSSAKYYAAISGLICFGFSMSIGSAILWPAVGLICSKQYLATAFGFIGCLDNTFQGCSFLMVGILTKQPNTPSKYEYVSYWFTCLAVVMLICVLLLWYFDKKQFNNVLNRREAKFEPKRENQSEHIIDKVNDVEL